MLKNLLSFFTVAALSASAGAATLEINLDNLSMWGAGTYDGATKTITFGEEWGAAALWIGDADYSKFTEMVVNYEKSDNSVSLSVAYAESAGVEASLAISEPGSDQVVCKLDPAGSAHIASFSISGASGSKLVLVSAYFQNDDDVSDKDYVLWSGDKAIDYWENGVQVPVSDLQYAAPKEGDRLSVSYTTTTGGGMGVGMLGKDWNVVKLPSFVELGGGLVESGSLSAVLGADDVAALTSDNNQCLFITGEGVNVTKVEILRSGTTGIEGISTDNGADCPVEYYNLQGVKVNTPSAGIYICRKGSDIKKVIIR